MKANLIKTLKQFGKIAAKTVDKHSPEILIACGIVGYISTCVLVAKEAPKAKEKLDILHENLAELEEEPSKAKVIVEEIKTVVPVYLPAIATGTVSTACILGSYKIGSRRTAALATAYELTQSSLIEYKNKVKETIGEKKEAAIENAIDTDKIKNDDKTNSFVNNHRNSLPVGEYFMKDSFGGQPFISNTDMVRQAQLRITNKLSSGVEEWVSINEFFDELGIGNTDAGDLLGWSDANDVNIWFSSILAEDMTPITVMHLYRDADEIGPRRYTHGDLRRY